MGSWQRWEWEEWQWWERVEWMRMGRMEMMRTGRVDENGLSLERLGLWRFLETFWSWEIKEKLWILLLDIPLIIKQFKI